MVEFSRYDGKSVQGRDIPYSFTQNVNVNIGIGSFVGVSFVLVQQTAKWESPLVDLVYSPEILKMEATITIYGQDVAGKRLAPVSGTVSVWFSDFAD